MKTAAILQSVVLLFFILLCSLSAVAQTTYYVSNNGDDGNDGRSENAAWRTIAKVNSTRSSPGDRILFRRGDAWTERLFPPTSGTESAPITYAAYGSGNRPMVDAGGPLPGWSDPANWTDKGNNIWTIALSWWPGRLWIDGDEYGCSGTTDQGSNIPTSQFRWWHDGSSTLSLHSEGNPSQAYGSIEIADRSGLSLALYVKGREYLFFRDLEFKRGTNCVELVSSSHITFDSCKILAGTSAYGLFLQQGSDYGLAKNCIFDREAYVVHTFYYGGGPSTGGGNDNVALQWANYWEFDHCTFGGCGHAGVEISGQLSGGSIFQSRYNKIHDCEFWGGTEYDRALIMNGIDDASYCSYNEFYRNYIHDMECVSQVTGLENKVYCNIFANQKHIPFDSEQGAWRSSALELSDYLNATPVHNMVWNNTFINCDMTALRVMSGQRNASVKNNLIVNGGIAGNSYVPNVGFTLWQGCTTDTIMNNLIYSNTTSKTIILNQQEWTVNSPTTVASLNAFDGKNENVVSGNLELNPLVASDFTIPIGSPAQAAGVDLGLSSDYFGNTVNSPPDIGAIQADTPPRPSGSITATPDSLPQAGGTLTLRWTSNDATTATIDQGIGSVALSGSRSITVSVNTSWTLTLTGAGGTTQLKASVRVLPLPIGSFKASPDSLQAGGGSVTLQWATSGATSATIDQGVGSVAVSGSRSLTVTANSTWTLSLTGAGGTTQLKASVRILPFPTGSFKASPDTLQPGGGTVTLQWSSSNATSATIDQEVGSVAVTGSRSLNVTATSSWTLTLAGTGGTAKLSASVFVAQNMIQPQSAPAPQTPGNRTALGARSVSLGWLAPSGATAYQLQVAADSLFRSLKIDDTTLTSTTYTIDSLPPQTTYWWRVRARSGADVSPFSPVWSFTSARKEAPYGTFSVTPGSLLSGDGTVTLAWDCHNTDSVRFNLGIGKVAVSGTRTFDVSATTLFTLTMYSSVGAATLLAETSVPVPAFANVRTITDAGSPLVSVTGPQGIGNHDINIIKDGIYPPVGSTDSVESFDTFTIAGGRTEDWVGYSYAGSHLFAGMVFCEGRHSIDGGWFASLRVQVSNAGAWADIPDVTVQPAYKGGAGASYQLYRLSFPSIKGTGFRLIGKPGGSAGYISVSELAVVEDTTSMRPVTSPQDFAMDQNYPNPFNPSTNIVFRLPVRSNVFLAVYNVLGQEVIKLIDGVQEAGFYRIPFNGDRLPNGVYFSFIRMGDYTFTRKMLLVK